MIRERRSYKMIQPSDDALKPQAPTLEGHQ